MQLLITIHPSYLLRIEDEAAKTREYERFVTDLKACVAVLGRETTS
jgi:DNA polymerase